MPPPRPRLAVIVANGITGDSRVQKVALSAARDGWDVRLIGRSLTGHTQRSRLGEVSVLRVVVSPDLNRAEDQHRKLGLPVLQPGSAQVKGREAWEARYEARQRLRSEQVSLLGEQGSGSAKATRFGLRAASFLDRATHRARTRAAAWDLGRLPDPREAVGDWRRDQPSLLDLDLAIGPAIEKFKPDVIHVNDITMLNTGAVAAARLRRRGRPVRWIYDAHEYVAGVDWPNPRMMSAFPQLEREYIHKADAVVTVSPEIAAMIQRDHHLPSTPLVVRNAPVRAAIGHGADVSVRAAAEVAEDVPLLVYSGYIQAQRGLDVAIDALPLLPGVHLAIVADQNNPQLAKLVRQAVRVGVSERVHPVPYVAQQDVADYLSTADLGIICSEKTINYEMSLPTKLTEYVHAGLPVVVSDLQTLGAYVNEHGIGRTFEAGNPVAFAAAVQEFLPERDAARANITEEMLDDLSWEHQTAGLLQLYRDLTGLDPQPRPELSWDVTEVFSVKAPPKLAGDHTVLTGDDVPWRKLTNTKIKLGLGTANSAGQLAGLAQAVTEADSAVSAEVITRTASSGFGFPSDVYLTRKQLGSLDTQLDLLRRVLPRYTHLISDAFSPIFGELNGTDIEADLPALRHAGIKVALLCHGSEIRDPHRHLDRLPHSHFNHAPPGLVDQLSGITRHNAEIIDRVRLPVFVTTPDLLADVPTATWVPLVVDIDAWTSAEPVLERARPIVVHAPSKRWTKGTDLFLPDLEELDAQGSIELRLIEGLPWPAMREQLLAADIVVDQVAIGSYGTLACEAMAAGKPVVAYLADPVLAAFEEAPPIVNTEPTQVREAVERLLADRAEGADIGRRAHEFARAVHDGRCSAEVLRSFLRS